ncbi:hypothetical protein GFS60_03253 [Rhodococcus sp. WAY2]|nr:hypothetical protein GFS60_03253 [Rhodococcus sp. WAY2]
MFTTGPAPALIGTSCRLRWQTPNSPRDSSSTFAINFYGAVSGAR